MSGLGLVVGFTAWIVYDAWLRYGFAGPMLFTVILCAVAYAGGRLGSRLVGRWLAPTLVLFVAVFLLLLYPLGLFDAVKIRFLGYDNSRSAFFIQVAFAGLMIAADRRWRMKPGLVRNIAFGAAMAGFALFTLLALRINSTAGRATTVFLLIGLYVVFRRKWKREAILLASIVLAGAIVSSFLLAEAFARGNNSPLVARAAASLGASRVDLWSEGYNLVRAHPLNGVGPDLFRLASTTAKSRPEVLQWAHSEFLQQAAETGFIGLGLLLGLFGWILYRLARTRTVLSTLAALAVAALGVHACVDYVLHFPTLPAIAAALAGTTAGPGRRIRRRRGAKSRARSADPAGSSA
jgi:O-antigen ligase